MSFRWQWSELVILLTLIKFAYYFIGQQLAGSLTGAVPCRKDIDRTQRQAHLAWKSRDECEGKSLSNCILKSKKCREETRA